MAETNQDRSPRLTRSVIGRMVGVGLFLALGTFAVIQMMTGDHGSKHDHEDVAQHTEDTTAEAEKKIEPDSANTFAKPQLSPLAKSDAFNPSKSSGAFAPPLQKTQNGFGGFSPPVKTQKNNTFAASHPPLTAKANPVVPVRAGTLTPKPNPSSNVPERFAQLPDDRTKGFMGNQSGFRSRPAMPNANPLQNKANVSVDSRPLFQQNLNNVNQFGNDMAKSANRFLNEVKQEAVDTAEQMKQKFPPLNRNSLAGIANPTQQNRSYGNTKSGLPKPLRGLEIPKMKAPTPVANPLAQNRLPGQGFGQTNAAITPKLANATTQSPPIQPFDRAENRQNGLVPINNRLPAIARPNQPRDTGSQKFGASLPAQFPNLTSQNRDRLPAKSSTSPFTQTASPRQLNPLNRNRRTNPGVLQNRSSNRLTPADMAQTTNTPGDRVLEGVQAPSLVIEKRSPREIQVNQSAEFEIIVKNVGRVTADDVNVFDQVPAGTQFEGASPEPTHLTQDRKINWNLGSMRPGQEKRIKFQLKPTQPGEIGSVARVTFATKASMRTLVTKPVLEITQQTKQKVLIGDDVIFDVVVQNKGDGAAKNVVIQEDVPPQLDFQDGYRELEYDIGTLQPGQSKRIQLGLKAAKIGRLKNIMFVSAAGGLKARHEFDMEVVAPNLEVTSQGPTRRFLNREVTHQFRASNSGTAKATNIDLIARLPAGLRYVKSDNRGKYDARSHAVYWSLAELGLGVGADVSLTTVPIEAGSQDVQFEAKADLNQKSATTQKLSVEHLVDVFFDIDDVVDPIEIGSDTSYRIRVVNQGTRAATNIQLQIEFPRGLIPTAVEGNLQNQIQGQKIQFAPISSLDPGQQLQLLVRAKGQAAGDHRVVVNMKADGRSTMVTKQESTRVYADH